MTRLRAPGTLVMLVVTGALAGILLSFVTENALFVSSPWRVPAAISLGVVLLVLLTFAAVGRPWQRWDRTAYW